MKAIRFYLARDKGGKSDRKIRATKKSDVPGVARGMGAEHFDRRITLSTHYVKEELNVNKCQMILPGIPYNISN